MPMIDVYATGGTFANPKALARDLASTLMKIEQVPDIPMFRQNTAAFGHDLRTWRRRMSTETATTSGCRCSRTRGRLIARSSSPWSGNSPTSLRQLLAMPRSLAGPGGYWPRR